MPTFHIAKYLSTTKPAGVTNNPVAVYKFDGTADYLTDRTGNGNTLTVTTGTFEWIKDLQSGLLGLYFNSAEAHELTGPNTDPLRISKVTGGGGSGALTVEAIINQEVVGGIVFACDASGDSLTTNSLYALKASNPFVSINEYAAGTNVTITYSEAVPRLNELLYLALTVSADGTERKLYINGNLYSTQTGTAAEKATSSNTQRLRIGRSYESSVDYKGSIFSLRITAETFSASSILDAYTNLSGTANIITTLEQGGISDALFSAPLGGDSGTGVLLPTADQGGIGDALQPVTLGGDAGTGVIPATPVFGLDDTLNFLSAGGGSGRGINPSDQPVGIKENIIISKESPTYAPDINDVDGKELIYDAGISTLFYYDATLDTWHTPTTAGFYGIGRDGKYYYNGVECAYGDFGTLADGIRKTAWSTGQDPLSNGGHYNNVPISFVSDGRIRLQSLVPVNNNWIGNYLTSAQRWYVSGDFTIDISWDNLVVTSAGDDGGFLLQVLNDRSNYTYVRRRGIARIDSDLCNNGSWVNYSYLTTSATSGSFRITRTGSTLKRYYDIGGGWVQIGSNYTFSTDRVWVKVELNGVGGTIMDVQAYDFSVTGTTTNRASWYEESSGIHRGTRQDFPTHALIVGTDSSIEIIDTDNDKLWMRFVKATNNILKNWNGVEKPYSLFMKDGVLLVGQSDGTQYGGMLRLDFNMDWARIHKLDSSSVTGADYKSKWGSTNWARDKAIGDITERNNARSWGNDHSGWQIPGEAVSSIAYAINGEYEYRVAATNTGVALFKWRRWYLEDKPTSYYPFNEPSRTKSTETGFMVWSYFDASLTLFYMSTTTLYSRDRTNGVTGWEDALGSTFTAQYSKALPGTNSLVSQRTAVKYSTYIYLARNEGVYRIDWPSGEWELFYGTSDSLATHKILPPYGKSTTVSFTIESAGPYDILLVGMEHGMTAISLASNNIYGSSELKINSNTVAVVS